MIRIGYVNKGNISPSHNKLGSTAECMCAFQPVNEAMQLIVFFHIHGSFTIVYYSNCSTIFFGFFHVGWHTPGTHCLSCSKIASTGRTCRYMWIHTHSWAPWGPGPTLHTGGTRVTCRTYGLLVFSS